MYKYTEIKSVHLEITSKCNASCPMCLRNISGGALNPQLPLTELSLEDLQHIFPKPFLQQLKRIYMCGNYGDPIMAKDTLSALSFFRETKPELSLSLFSNASARSSFWWKELAKVVDLVHFSIDGLEDTNPIYRKGTDFKKIMANAKSYISAGGKAVWDFIVFAHNEHQVETARKLAFSMGFERFVVKKTGRFFSNTRSKVKKEQAVLNKKGEVEYYLKMPSRTEYQNFSLQKEKELIKEYGSLIEYLNQSEIKCKVKEEKSLYISAEGLAFPCCWLANRLYPWYLEKRSSQIWQWIENLPEKENSLCAKKHSLESIIESNFFQKTIPQSWQGKTINQDKLRVCAKTCGQKFKPFSDQFL